MLTNGWMSSSREVHFCISRRLSRLCQAHSKVALGTSKETHPFAPPLCHRDNLTSSAYSHHPLQTPVFTATASATRFIARVRSLGTPLPPFSATETSRANRVPPRPGRCGQCFHTKICPRPCAALSLLPLHSSPAMLRRVER